MSRSISLNVACLLVVIATKLNAAAIFDFNSPAYTVGALSGQQGWSAGVNASVANLSGSDNALVVTANQSASHSLAGSGFGPITSVSFLTAVSSGLAYSEVHLVDSGSNKYAHVGLQKSVTNNFYYYDDTGIQYGSGPGDHDKVYLIDMTLDFNTQKYRATFTDTTDSSLDFDSGFVDLVTATTAALGEAGKIVLWGGVDGQSGFFDDISVSAVPEPSSLFIGSIGLVGLIGTLRRRRTACA